MKLQWLKMKTAILTAGRALFSFTARNERTLDSIFMIGTGALLASWTSGQTISWWVWVLYAVGWAWRLYEWSVPPPYIPPPFIQPPFLDLRFENIEGFLDWLDNPWIEESMAIRRAMRQNDQARGN